MRVVSEMTEEDARAAGKVICGRFRFPVAKELCDMLGITERLTRKEEDDGD